MDFKISKADASMTVLDFLRRRVGVSRAMLSYLKFIDNGITVDGKHVTVRHLLAEGETLTVLCEDTAPSEKIEPKELPLDIVYEDGEVVVPNKPPFMPTHPSHGHFDDTLANALAYRYRNGATPFVFRPVNRLDRNTSGLVLISRTRIAAAKLFESMKRGEIQKEYIALLCGVPSLSEGEIETYIKRSADSVITREVCDRCDGADHALTKYKVLYSSDTHSVVLARPITGRTHQLRVHFAYIGCPIVGDDMYGSESEHISRHALHSASLTFTHPESGERISLNAPLPDDMLRLVSELFGKAEAEKIEELCGRAAGEDK